MKSKIKSIIVGAGAAGKELSKEIKKNLSSTFELVGFIDDDEKKSTKIINGLKVLGKTSDLEKLIKKNNIQEVFIALPSAEGEVIKNIISSCNKQKVIFKIVPRILEIVLGKVNLQKVREVEVQDLLGRPIIKADQQKFIKFFNNKKILVTGAAGSIGSEICRQILQFNPKKLICLDSWETGLFDLNNDLKSVNENFQIIVGNIRDKDKLDRIFKVQRPDFVFHAAAYKHVPLMQENPDEAIQNNIFGTQNLIDISLKNKVKKFINISTDKAADPSSIMGCTKFISENLIYDADKKGIGKFISVRFGNVLDSNGSVVPTFRKQINSGGPVTVTHPDMTRFFMTIPEAVQLVLESAIIGKGSEIFILDMGNPVKIDDLAKLMITLSGFIPEEEIKIKYTGIRPGEKLYEILSTSNEIIEKTTSPKIFKIKSLSNKINTKSTIEKLKKLVYSKNREDIVHFLKTLAPNLKK